MKIIALLGSARKKGNTAAILGWVEEELCAMGHEVETITLNDKNINGCMGCAKCKDVPDRLGCIQQDDALPILEAMTHADAVLFASPLYFWGFSAQVKALLDRSYCLVTNYHKPDHSSLVEGQRHAFLITGGGLYENNADSVFTTLKRIRAFHKTKAAGEWFVEQCTTPEEMDPSLKIKAAAFAGNIVA